MTSLPREQVARQEDNLIRRRERVLNLIHEAGHVADNAMPYGHVEPKLLGNTFKNLDYSILAVMPLRCETWRKIAPPATPTPTT